MESDHNPCTLRRTQIKPGMIPGTQYNQLMVNIYRRIMLNCQFIKNFKWVNCSLIKYIFGHLNVNYRKY